MDLLPVFLTSRDDVRPIRHFIAKHVHIVAAKPKKTTSIDK
jgi:hypothetical protein